MESGKKIWVLEDDHAIGEIVELLLMEEGYDVKLFDSVASFKTSLDYSIADLIIMDVLLPDGNGMEVCQYLKTDEQSSIIPILMMSATADFKTVMKTCSASDFIAKPFDINNFVNKVNRLAS